MRLPYLRAVLARSLIDFFGSDNRRIDHALQVLHEAEILLDRRSGCDPDIVIAAALLHDVGIKPSEEKLGYNNGQTQEEYGPPVAEALLQRIGFPPEKTRIVKEIVGNHHSPSRYGYPELELLKEADRIVNNRNPEFRPELYANGMVQA